jgi:hypothetical protein
MEKENRIIKKWLMVFMIGLFLSGLTAIPIEMELQFLSRLFPTDTNLGAWFDYIYWAIKETTEKYPFIAYGYDWLAFAHFVLAILFIGPYRDPVRNKWVVEFGIIACVLIIPFAFVAGHFREIPLIWRLIDCSFGIVGLIPLRICLHKINKLEALDQKTKQHETVK